MGSRPAIVFVGGLAARIVLRRGLAASTKTTTPTTPIPAATTPTTTKTPFVKSKSPTHESEAFLYSNYLILMQHLLKP